MLHIGIQNGVKLQKLHLVRAYVCLSACFSVCLYVCVCVYQDGPLCVFACVYAST